MLCASQHHEVGKYQMVNDAIVNSCAMKRQTATG